MSRLNRSLWAAAAATAAAILASAPAFAQHQEDTSRANDANNRIGSGGFNDGVRLLSAALVVFATALSLCAAGRPSPTLHDVLARAADATAAFADPSRRIVCQESDRQTTVVDLPSVSTDMPSYDPRPLAYRDIVASWSMTPPSPHGSGAWDEVLDVESRGPFQPFPSIRALQRLTAIIDRTIDVPAPLPRWATGFLSARNQPRFEFSKVGETEVQGLTLWEVKFRETTTPSLWRQPISGSFWLGPSTGRVVRSAIAVGPGAPFSDEMTVDYRLDQATALYLPHSLTRRTDITSERTWVETTGERRLARCTAWWRKRFPCSLP